MSFAARGNGAAPPAAEAHPPGDEAGEAGRAKPKKAPNAFRTISEVADDLHIPQHVLRFWETKFTQVKPLKRGGGRRYYRPDDIGLLRRISDLLYIQGYTIKGVQRLLREGGGKLSDDIPPPAPEERAAGEAGDPELPLHSPRAATPRRAEEHTATEAAALREAARLRALLVQTLTELEALRALLP
jgi:DNA-binding transcriptional MerR regulator